MIFAPRRRRSLVRSAAALACALLLASSAPSRAAGVAPSVATTEQKKSAMDHFAAGKKALDDKQYDKAVGEFRASLEVVESPNARLELARALRDSGNVADAWNEYGRVIDTATKMAAQEERYAKTAIAASAERTEMEPRVAFVVPSVVHATADTKLEIGGRAVPPGAWHNPVAVMPGSIDIVVESGGKEVARKNVTVVAGDKAPITLDAQPAASTPAAPAPLVEPAPSETAAETPPAASTAEPTPASSDKTKLRTSAYVAGGVGAAGLVAFTVFGLLSESKYSDLQSACPGGRCPPGKQDEVDSGRTQQTMANVGLAIGVVGIATGATLFFLSQPKDNKPAPPAALVVAPGYLGVRGSL